MVHIGVDNSAETESTGLHEGPGFLWLFCR
jgi:hypothetical protein